MTGQDRVFPPSMIIPAYVPADEYRVVTERSYGWAERLDDAVLNDRVGCQGLVRVYVLTWVAFRTVFW